MKIEANYPKYKVQIEPEDITTMGEPIGECDLTKEPVFVDYSKMDCEPPKEEDAWEHIADDLGLDRHYVKFQMKEVFTWFMLRNLLDMTVSPYAEISSIEMHNYSEGMEVDIDYAEDGALIISDK